MQFSHFEAHIYFASSVYLSLPVLLIDQLLVPLLMLLYLLHRFTRQVQFGLFLVGRLPTVLRPNL